MILDPALLLTAPIGAALAVAALAYLVPWRVAAGAAPVSAVAVLASGAAIAAEPADLTLGGLLRADALTAWMLIAVGAVATIATVAAPAHLRHEGRAAQRRYLLLTQLFLACMTVAVLADNLGLLWVAIEATTVVTAFLVGHHRTRASVEAAWKYVVLCSVGVALAFLGTVCVYAASIAAGGDGVSALNWSELAAHPDALDPSLLRLAAGLVVLGFGTKAGLAPMHAWLPDAHSQAPAPVSALMSGVLLSVAFYAILRYKTIFDAVLGPGYLRTLLIVAALASLAVAAALLIAQRDYKRLLAYSSIEHMGLIALGAAFGAKLAVAAALLHILGHGIAKAVAFCGAGRILHVYATTDILGVRGLTARQPALAAVFATSLIALLGLPPFGPFASELGIARGGFLAGQGWVLAVAFALMLVASAAIVRHTTTMLLTSDPESTSEKPSGGWMGLVAMTVGLVAVAILGLYLGPLQRLLDAATIVAGGH
jgi:hydrogenase-4 component F